MPFPKGKQPKGRAAVFRNPEAGKAGSATVCGSGAADQNSQKAAGLYIRVRLGVSRVWIGQESGVAGSSCRSGGGIGQGDFATVGEGRTVRRVAASDDGDVFDGAVLRIGDGLHLLNVLLRDIADHIIIDVNLEGRRAFEGDGADDHLQRILAMGIGLIAEFHVAQDGLAAAAVRIGEGCTRDPECELLFIREGRGR